MLSQTEFPRAPRASFHVHFTCISRAFHMSPNKKPSKENSFTLDLRERMRVHMCVLANEEEKIGTSGGHSDGVNPDQQEVPSGLLIGK